MVKKITVTLFMAMAAISMAACGNSSSATDSTKVAETTTEAKSDTKSDASSIHTEFKQVTNYLYEVTYDGYEDYYDDAREQLQSRFETGNETIGACSSVQNGYIRGRNYDWTLDEVPEFVIHVPAAENRHASIGVSSTGTIQDSQVQSGEEIEDYKVLPYSMLDGINDAGVTINTNVVNYGEKGEFVMKTEDTSDDVCPLSVGRFVLDQADSVDEAISIISDMDIYSLGGGEECHFMISGPQSEDDDTFNTVVVELIPDENKHYQVNVIDYNKGEFVDDKPVVTNFHLTGFDGTVESLTEHPMGYERYLILADAFDQGKTVAGMKMLMKKVYYTNDYDLYNDRWWYSEDCNKENGLTMADVGEESLDGDISKAGKFADEVKQAQELYENSSRTSENKIWHTVHTSVYDCKNKTLSVIPQEGGYSFDFALE